MTAVTSCDVIQNFSAVAARVAVGDDLNVTRHGKPQRKPVRVRSPESAYPLKRPLGVQVVNPFATLEKR